jgi:hypothetical protein
MLYDKTLQSSPIFTQQACKRRYKVRRETEQKEKRGKKGFDGSDLVELDNLF